MSLTRMGWLAWLLFILLQSGSCPGLAAAETKANRVTYLDENAH
jgi:hypothetical protein